MKYKAFLVVVVVVFVLRHTSAFRRIAGHIREFNWLERHLRI